MLARVLSRPVRRAVLRRPTPRRNLSAVLAGMVTSTEPADEIGQAPAGQRRLAGCPALISLHVPAADRVQRVLDAMTAAERVKVERRAVPGPQESDLAELGVRLPRVRMTRTARGRPVGPPERGRAVSQATATAAPHAVTQGAGGRTRTELPTAPDRAGMLVAGRTAMATATAPNEARMLAADQTAGATTTAVVGAALLAVARIVMASVVALAIGRRHTAAVAVLASARTGTVSVAAHVAARTVTATVAVLAASRTGTDTVAQLAAARTGTAIVRTMRGEKAIGPACGCHRCRLTSPPISWILRHEPS